VLIRRTTDLKTPPAARYPSEPALLFVLLAGSGPAHGLLVKTGRDLATRSLLPPQWLATNTGDGLRLPGLGPTETLRFSRLMVQPSDLPQLFACPGGAVGLVNAVASGLWPAPWRRRAPAWFLPLINLSRLG